MNYQRSTGLDGPRTRRDCTTWKCRRGGKNYGENDQKRSLLPGGLPCTSSTLPVFTLRRSDVSLSSVLKRGRRADNLSVGFLWMFSDGGHMVSVRRRGLNLYKDRHTSLPLVLFRLTTGSPFTFVYLLANREFVRGIILNEN